MELSRVWVLLATGFRISYIPQSLAPSVVDRKWTGAGFLGTLEGLLLTLVLPRRPLAFGLFLAAAIVLACWICGKAEVALGRHDDPRIVLDEIVGFWCAVAFLPWTPRVLLAAFLLFRVLDAFKAPPMSWLERLPGGAGVVADDVGAGLIANGLLRLLLPQWAWLGAA